MGINLNTTKAELVYEFPLKCLSKRAFMEPDATTPLRQVIESMFVHYHIRIQFLFCDRMWIRIIKRTMCTVGLARLIYRFGFMNEFDVNLEIGFCSRSFLRKSKINTATVVVNGQNSILQYTPKRNNIFFNTFRADYFRLSEWMTEWFCDVFSSRYICLDFL